ncbi:MAG: winged helix-turn-helix transcriptional regulator [Paracoccaceae bacterium]|nr:winged helix-turn-helix transcriptional regulator [Paracoccaceae bacterium]
MTAPALQALGALGDPSRRAIFEHLTTREATVTDIADRLPITRSAVSQHLRVLKEAGLVTDHAEGRNRIYRIDPRGIGAMRAWLDTQWKDSLDAFRAFADRTASDGESPE